MTEFASPHSEPSPLSPAEPSPEPRKHRRAWTWVWRIVVTLVIVGLAGLSGYLVVVADKWSERVDELTAISTDLGQQVAQSKADAQTASAQRDDALTQLDELKERSTDLVNQEAQAKDNQSVLINYLDAMSSCASQRQELIDVLTDSRYYFPGKTNAQVENEITAYCNEVQSSVDAIKAEINK